MIASNSQALANLLLSSLYVLFFCSLICSFSIALFSISDLLAFLLDSCIFDSKYSFLCF